jgi:hypothetical protein
MNNMEAQQRENECNLIMKGIKRVQGEQIVKGQWVI